MEQKLALLSQLIQLAKADEGIKDEEYHLIWSMAQMLEVPRKEFDELLRYDRHTVIKASEFERILQFHRLVLLVHIDLEVNSIELQRLREFGFKLGLRPEAVNRVLEEMRNHENGMIPPETMLRIFQTYHN